MINGFRHKGLEIFHLTGDTQGVQTAHAAKLSRILAALDAATSPAELNHHEYKLQALTGDTKGHWSLWVNDNWRVTFRFDGAHVDLVDYQDHHQERLPP